MQRRRRDMRAPFRLLRPVPLLVAELLRVRGRATPTARNAAREPAHGFVVHGLWPQFEEGWPEFCDSDEPIACRTLSSTTMLDIMPSAGLIGHQWRKHGTCTGLSQATISTRPAQAFERVAIPSRFARASRMRVMLSRRCGGRVHRRPNDGLAPDGIAVTCDSRLLREVRICLTTELDFRACPEVDRAAASLPPARPAAALALKRDAHCRHGAASQLVGNICAWSFRRMHGDRCQILYSPASPYSAKVRMAAVHTGTRLRRARSSTRTPNPAVLSDGQSARQDSRVSITDDGQAGLRQPRHHAAYQPDDRQHALSAQRGQAAGGRTAGGARATASATACSRMSTNAGFARRKSPPALAGQQWSKAMRALDQLNASPPKPDRRSRTAGTSRCAPRSAIWRCDSTASGSAAAPS